jgi:hypothetical protein
MLIKRYLYIDSNHKKRVASVGNNIIYGYIVTYCCGISVVKSLKLFTLPYPFLPNIIQLNNIILFMNCSYVISPYMTNKYLKNHYPWHIKKKKRTRY